MHVIVMKFPCGDWLFNSPVAVMELPAYLRAFDPNQARSAYGEWSRDNLVPKLTKAGVPHKRAKPIPILTYPEWLAEVHGFKMIDYVKI